MAEAGNYTAKTAILKGFMALFVCLWTVPAGAENSFQPASTIAQPGLRGSVDTGPRMNVEMKSLLDLRWENVVRQQIEVGCGAASLATILTHYFDFPTTEEEMFYPLLEASGARVDMPNVHQVGFSMLEIRQVAGRGGLAAGAFRLEPEELERVRIPVVTRIKINGFDHFVVIKETVGGRVYVADPFYGNTSYRLGKFASMWSGVVMGFARRNQPRPLDHELVVADDDDWVIQSEDIMRLASRTSVDVAAKATIPAFTRIDLFDRITPQVTGLRSALPSFLSNSVFID